MNGEKILNLFIPLLIYSAFILCYSKFNMRSYGVNIAKICINVTIMLITFANQ